MRSKIFYRDIFILLIDANIEYYISIYLNEESRSYKLMSVPYENRGLDIFFPSNDYFPKANGDLISNILCKFCLFLLFVLLPTGYLQIYQQDLETIKSNRFLQKWGYLYEGLKIENSMRNIQFFLTFILRRLVFVFLAFETKPFFSLMGLIFMNILMTIHLGHLTPFKTRYLNFIYLFNEMMIGVVSIHMMMYTEWIKEYPTQVDAGWSMSFWILFTIIVNLI
jgi:hypothetical protein